jgi:integrase
MRQKGGIMARFDAKFSVTVYRGARIREVRKGACWQADFTALGKQARKRFDSIAKAKTWIDQKEAETRNKGLAAFELVDHDRLDVADARKWLAADVRLATVFDFWKLHHPAVAQKAVEALVEAFLAAPGRRGGKIVERREHTTEGHRKRLLSFVEAYGRRMANEIATADISNWLDAHGWTGLNRRHYLGSARALFGYALRQNLVAVNPAVAIELPEVKAADPVIMTTAEVEKYLCAIERVCPELLPREAIAFFCGLRPEELSRLDWKNVSAENKLITVTGEVAKVQGHRRNVEMPDNLVAWLAPYIRHAGKVWPYESATTLHTKRVEARTAAGVEVPDNAGRHAFASYHLAAFENSPKTAEALGHGNVTLLRSVYRNVVARDGRPITKTAGEAFFQIVPKREGEQKTILFQVAG